MSKDFTLLLFVVLATLSSGLLGSAAFAVARGSARIPQKAVVSSGAVSLLWEPESRSHPWVTRNSF